MASIIGKKQDGKIYYYLAESARVDGKPRIISQQYLGTAGEVAARLAKTGPGEPVRTQHKSFGDLAAVWAMLQRLDLAGIIDTAVPAQPTRTKVSVGTYLCLAIANRIVAPCSKAAFADWWDTTSGPRFTKISKSRVDHRRFWDAMDAIDATALEAIEDGLAKRVQAVFDLDLSGLVIDMTNFATFIDSTNTRAPIAQRGKAKQKRYDLRLVGLALTVTRDGAIPLISHAYPGNHNDVSQFGAVFTSMLARYRSLGADPAQMTVVYDAGQNSSANHELITTAGCGFVGSLPPSDHQELLARPADDYTPVCEETYPGLSCIDTTVTALGATARGVLTHSPTLHEAQARGFDQTLAGAARSLNELADRLARGKTRRSREKVEAEITQITKNTWVAECVSTTLTGDKPSEFRLTWHVDDDARAVLEDRVFGKRILFTNRTQWTPAQIVAAYRSQNDVEASFRQMKDTQVVSFTPMHHFTEQKIRVHVFTCVTALTIAHLMRREAEHAGIDLSVRELLHQLAGIGETVLLYHDGNKGRPRARRMLTDHSSIAKRLGELFGIDRYTPRR